MFTSYAAALQRNSRTIVPVLALLLFAGGFRAALADGPVNPFAGSWSGTYQGSCCGEGTQEWTISESGRLTGTATNTAQGFTNTFAGHVASDGKVTLSANLGGGGGGSWTGQASINSEGQFVGTFVANRDNSSVIEVIMDRVN